MIQKPYFTYLSLVDCWLSKFISNCAYKTVVVYNAVTCKIHNILIKSLLRLQETTDPSQSTVLLLYNKDEQVTSITGRLAR